jgi:hypothetical protein
MAQHDFYWSPQKPAQPLAEKAMRNFKRIIFGAPDENSRLWLREDEAKALLQNTSKGYQATFFEEEGVWRSSRGYFRLFRHLDGTKGLVFGFDFRDLAVDEMPNSAFPGGIKRTFRNTKRTYLAALWSQDDPVKLEDIILAISSYSSGMRKAVADHTILYETDKEKGIFRSGGVAYVLEFEEAGAEAGSPRPRVKEIKRYSNPIDTGSLVNPFGDNMIERFLQGFDPGVGLLAQHARQRAVQPNDPRQSWWRKLPPSQHISISREEAEAIIFRDYLTAGWRYMHRLDPATDDDKKLNLRYYKIRRAAQVTGAIFASGHKRLGKFSFEKAPEIRGFMGSVLALVRDIIIGGFFFVIFPLITGSLNFYGMIKGNRRKDPAIFIDTRDPLVKTLSHDSPYIEALRPLMRRINGDAFRQVEILSRETFDKVPPYGIKRERSLKHVPHDLVEPAMCDRGLSVFRYYLEKGTRPSAHPDRDATAIKFRRPDGVLTTKFVKEQRAWGIYSGELFHPKSTPPSPLMMDLCGKGKVLEVVNSADARMPSINHIPLPHANKSFTDRFGYPLEDINPAPVVQAVAAPAIIGALPLRQAKPRLARNPDRVYIWWRVAAHKQTRRVVKVLSRLRKHAPRWQYTPD